MAQNKKSVLLYCDIIHTIEELEDSDAGLLFKHYLRYINDLNPEPPNKLIRIVFEPIKQNLKRDLKKWEDKSLKNRENAKMRWNANASERIKVDANHADKVTDTVTDKDIYNEFLSFLNLTLTKKYKGGSKDKAQFFARIKEGYSLENFKQAISNASKDQFHVQERFRHLTPEFITRQDKLDKFLNAIPFTKPQPHIQKWAHPEG